MSENQVEEKNNTNSEKLRKISRKEMKREISKERKEEKHENKEHKKREKKEHKSERKKEKYERKIEEIENRSHHHHTYEKSAKNAEKKTREIDRPIEKVERPIKNNTISEEKIQKRNIPLDSEWAGIISCDPSEIPDDISFSMSSVTPDQIPDDIEISMSEFNQESQDSIKVKKAKNNLTESDLSPELELKDEKTVPGSQPNVGERGVFESKYYQSSESKHENKY